MTSISFDPNSKTPCVVVVWLTVTLTGLPSSVGPASTVIAVALLLFAFEVIVCTVLALTGDVFSIDCG